MPAKKKARTTVRKKQPSKAKKLRHKIVLHPITVMLVLCIGVFIITYTLKAVADSYTVSAIVPAPMLSSGAYITDPTSGQTFTNSSLNVSGTCPNLSYIKLYDNNIFVGVAWCLPNETFLIATQLYEGQNNLQVQDYNVTNSPGPVTSIVPVSYNQVNSSQGSSSSSSSNSSSTSSSSSSASSTGSSNSSNSSSNNQNSSESLTAPLLLTGDYQFKATEVGIPFTSSITLQGGNPPYYVTVNWGDGSSTAYTFDTDPTFTIKHIYYNQGYYPVLVKVADTKGTDRDLQIAALIKQPGSSDVFLPTTSSTSGKQGSSNSSNCTNKACNQQAIVELPKSNASVTGFLASIKSWVWIAWSSYAVVLLMMISFWLGEREEDYHLFKHRLRSKSRKNK